MRSFVDRLKALKTFTNLEIRFWMKVDVRSPEECWPWTGAQNSPDGKYRQGIFGIRAGKNVIASRFAFESFHGHSPEDQVLHSCDNGLCCNPHHLEDGTQSKNIKDAYARGRKESHFTKHPWRLGNRRITEQAVRDIRRLNVEGQSQASIARQFDISRAQVCRIVSGKNWGQVA